DTALMAAARGGDLGTVRVLVEAGVDVNARGYREAALHKAAKNGHREVYEYLEPMSTEEIRQDAHPLLQKGIERKQLHESFDSEDLTEAIEDENLEGIHQLIDRGVNVDGRDPSGQTPLMLASLYGTTAIVEGLLEAGADPNLSSEVEGLEHGATALMMAAESPFAEDRPRVISALVEAGADPDARDTEQGWTALMRAILTRDGLVDSVESLIAAGADLEIHDHEGKTALMMAREAANERIVRLLEAARAAT
ncbi:MAG: ankyrin repeat domain-containing protein, partial [bacterium]|nr:ankyrin repeat domain-containing protein [bacterium]